MAEVCRKHGISTPTYDVLMLASQVRGRRGRRILVQADQHRGLRSFKSAGQQALQDLPAHKARILSAEQPFIRETPTTNFLVPKK